MNATKGMYRSLFSKLAIAFGTLILFRFLFIIFNYKAFDGLNLNIFLGGARFDIMTMGILFLPFIFGHFVDVKGRSLVLKILFFLAYIPLVLLSTLDLEYYKFTQKRTGSELFQTQGMGEDVQRISGSLLTDFWYLFIIAGLIIWIAFKLYKRTVIPFDRPNWRQYILFLIPVFGLEFAAYRGGMQLKPLKVIDAGSYAKAENIPVVVNTPFVFIKSFSKKGLTAVKYFDSEELNRYYNPVHELKPSKELSKKNVVLIIAESFNKEYIGTFNPPGYTPFLDSLISKSLVFPYAFANGKKSIEALPAILSSVPSLMESPYIASKYGSNKVESLASILNEQGYTTSFFHGGANGTMGFDSYTEIAGVDQYYGLDEYNSNEGHDGSWGIFDEPYLAYVVDEISEMSEPFFTSVFTLSSHHPYAVPDSLDSHFKGGPIPILKSVEYADHALQRFFEKAQKQPWFDETLFIITADHTSQFISPVYNNRVDQYAIPLIFYSPSYISPALDERVAQQSDIFPSVLDWMGIPASFVGFGQSVFSPDTSQAFAVNYINGVYQIIDNDFLLQYDGERVIGLFEYRKDKLLSLNLAGKGLPSEKALESKLKAIIQQYQRRLIYNQLTKID